MDIDICAASTDQAVFSGDTHLALLRVKTPSFYKVFLFFVVAFFSSFSSVFRSLFLAFFFLSAA